MRSLAATSALVLVFAAYSTVAVPPERQHLPTYTDRATFPRDVHFTEQSHDVSPPRDGRPYAEHSTSYLSAAMPLAPGEVVFTDPQTTFLQFPPGKIAVTGFWAAVVDEDNNAVPLSEAYLHHWLVFGPPNAGVCGGYLAYNFGVGAESRGSPVHYPDPFALVVDSETQWGANIHILRTVDLNQTYGVKNCIECLYAPGKGCEKEESGKFACCQDGSFCPTVNGNRTRGVDGGKAKNYYLAYTVYWREIDESVKPVTIYVLDASSCQIEYNIFPNPSNLSVTELSFTVPKDMGLVFGAGHQHIGAYNITLYDGTGTDKPICTNTPVYGTQKGVPGNEQGYVVKIPPCRFSDPYPLKAGSTVRLVSLYNVGESDDRTWDTGMHGGVMSLYYVATVDL